MTAQKTTFHFSLTISWLFQGITLQSLQSHFSYHLELWLDCAVVKTTVNWIVKLLLLFFFLNQNIRMCIILLRVKILYSFQTVHLILQKSLEVISNSKTWSFGWFSQGSKATSWLTRKTSTPEKWKQFIHCWYW